METIAGILNQCLKDFTAFTTSSALALYEAEVPYHRWLDELGRLRIWSGNMGAHQTGQSSLDYRLRDSSHLKNETLKLLHRLLRVLQDLTLVINEDDDDDDDEEDYEIVLESDKDEDETLTEVQQLYQGLVDVVDLMFQISMAIRQPADHDRLIGMKVKNESYFEPWARQHISHKHPNAEAETIDRLTTAMARQKAILKYRERHRAKLAQGLPGDEEARSTKLSETVATELPQDGHLRFLETASNSGFSQTSYATSLMAGEDRISVPNPPRESADKSLFECPYCFHIITIKNRKDWARHVFRDLMPYVCLAWDCLTPSRLYESRSQWYCHMRNLHPTMTGKEANFICPLCQNGITAPPTFEKHVSRHLEELALFVLPRTSVDDKENSGLSSEATSDHEDRGGRPDFTGDSDEDSEVISQTASDTVPGLEAPYNVSNIEENSEAQREGDIEPENLARHMGQELGTEQETTPARSALGPQENTVSDLDDIDKLLQFFGMDEEDNLHELQREQRKAQRWLKARKEQERRDEEYARYVATNFQPPHPLRARPISRTDNIESE